MTAKVFISWSKERSKAVAIALKTWLENVLQGAEVWVSAKNIDAGKDWNTEIRKHLEAANCGLIVITPENQKEPWLLFEAGALAKAFDSNAVPVLYDLPKAAPIVAPLAFRQGVWCDPEGFRQIVEVVNKKLEKLLPEAQLDRAFKKWTPDLEEDLKKVPPFAGPAPEGPTPDQKMDEILETVRAIKRNPPSTTVFTSPSGVWPSLRNYRNIHAHLQAQMPQDQVVTYAQFKTDDFAFPKLSPQDIVVSLPDDFLKDEPTFGVVGKPPEKEEQKAEKAVKPADKAPDRPKSPNKGKTKK